MEDEVDFVYLAVLVREVLDLLNVLVVQGDAVLLAEGHVLGDGDGPVPGDVRLVKHRTQRCKQPGHQIDSTKSSVPLYCLLIAIFFAMMDTISGLRYYPRKNASDPDRD